MGGLALFTWMSGKFGVAELFLYVMQLKSWEAVRHLCPKQAQHSSNLKHSKLAAKRTAKQRFGSNLKIASAS